MRTYILSAFAALTVAIAALGAGATNSIVSAKASSDAPLTADPNSAFWKPVRGVLANHDNMGRPVAKNTMEVRSRWTERNLYLLFSCPFDALTLKPNPRTDQETFALWNWDVAEAFIGDDFKNIKRYKEFEVSPQGEWVDLDIDKGNPGSDSQAWRWNSHFQVKARIDRAQNVWYAEMQIPFSAISRKPPVPDLQLRINFFRAAGQDPNRLLLTWRPTHQPTFHVPEAFGVLQLSASAPLR